MRDEDKLKGSPHPAHVKRFQSILDTLHSVGSRGYQAVYTYLEVRDNIFKDFPNKESKKYKLYDFLMGNEGKVPPADAVHESILGTVEERVRERVAESKRKIAGLRGQL